MSVRSMPLILVILLLLLCLEKDMSESRLLKRIETKIPPPPKASQEFIVNGTNCSSTLYTEVYNVSDWWNNRFYFANPDKNLPLQGYLATKPARKALKEICFDPNDAYAYLYECIHDRCTCMSSPIRTKAIRLGDEEGISCLVDRNQTCISMQGRKAYYCIPGFYCNEKNSTCTNCNDGNESAGPYKKYCPPKQSSSSRTQLRLDTLLVVPFVVLTRN